MVFAQCSSEAPAQQLEADIGSTDLTMVGVVVANLKRTYCFLNSVEDFSPI